MIADSTVLICLSKINQLTLLKDVFSTITITQPVREEVLIEGKEGYFGIKRAIESRWIKVVNPKHTHHFGLGGGENSVINLAKERKERVILDDAFAIKVARGLSIDYIRTTTVLFIAARKKIITKSKAVELLNKLIEKGYYIPPKMYSVLLTRLKS